MLSIPFVQACASHGCGILLVCMEQWWSGYY